MKKVKMIGLAVTFTVTLFFFLKHLFTVLAFIKSPLDFKFQPIFISIGLLFLLVFHLAGYVFIMDEKAKVKKVTDIDEWWTKWDRE